MRWIKNNFCKINSVLAKILINLGFILGMVFCLTAPIILFKYTGLNLYENYSIQDSFSYSECNEMNIAGTHGASLMLRSLLANMLYYLIMYCVIYNLSDIQPTGSVANKVLMGASCVIVNGGFEGLGDPELDAQHVTPNTMHTATQQESHIKDEGSESSKVKPTEKSTTSGYPFWPRPTPAVNIPTLPESNSEPEPTIENNKKTVRLNGFTEVKDISELGLDNTKDTRKETLQLEPKDKQRKHKKHRYTIDLVPV